MAIDMPEETLAQLSINFARLQKINISVCDYEWADILALSHLWPKLNEMIAAYNRIKKIIPPTITLRTLTVLKLDGNPIDRWSEIMKLGSMKNLKVLSLNDCQLTEIRFNDIPDEKVDIFEQLEVLFLNRNKINNVSMVTFCFVLPCVKKFTR